jgi:multimeric flavodoxin WrbA/protein-tyrosine-phosphatase
MLILGLQGSPRKKGNSHHLLSTFMKEAQQLGADTIVIDVPRRDIRPCLELIVCEKKGFCPIKDDMQREIYTLIRQADLIILVSPVFFYSVTAQLKALIDRCQTLWARKYKLKLADPNSPWRQGLLLSVGATKGKELFTGLELTAKYFFDAVDAVYKGSLTYPNIEGPYDLKHHAGMPAQVAKEVRRLLTPIKKRHRILFTCQKNDCLSQMAAAMIQFKAGDILEVSCAGSTPAKRINPSVADVMAEKGIDMAFRIPQGLDKVIQSMSPDIIVGLDCWEACPYLPDIRRINWSFPNLNENSIKHLRSVRDKIEEKVNHLIEEFRQFH